jgi:hypothetical protein
MQAAFPLFSVSRFVTDFRSVDAIARIKLIARSIRLVQYSLHPRIRLDFHRLWIGCGPALAGALFLYLRSDEAAPVKRAQMPVAFATPPQTGTYGAGVTFCWTAIPGELTGTGTICAWGSV